MSAEIAVGNDGDDTVDQSQISHPVQGVVVIATDYHWDATTPQHEQLLAPGTSGSQVPVGSCCCTSWCARI